MSAMEPSWGGVEPDENACDTSVPGTTSILASNLDGTSDETDAASSDDVEDSTTDEWRGRDASQHDNGESCGENGSDNTERGNTASLPSTEGRFLPDDITDPDLGLPRPQMGQPKYQWPGTDDEFLM